MTTTDCYKCLSSKWRATGRFNENRFGRRRAELVCETCGYAFSSGKPDGIEAGELAKASGVNDTEMAAVIPQRTIPGTRVQQPIGEPEMTRVGSLGKALDRDWKSAQAGDE